MPPSKSPLSVPELPSDAELTRWRDRLENDLYAQGLTNACANALGADIPVPTEAELQASLHAMQRQRKEFSRLSPVRQITKAIRQWVDGASEWAVSMLLDAGGNALSQDDVTEVRTLIDRIRSKKR